MNTKAAGLIYGPNLHYLDHLAPLSSILGIDLLTNEEQINQSAKIYYPNLKTQYYDNTCFNYQLVKNYSLIISCFTRDFFDAEFAIPQDLLNKHVKTIWCPHGNSDKGKNSFFFEALIGEKLALVYGQKMLDFIKEKNVLDKISAYQVIGNYRYHYFQQHKPFYDQLIEKKILNSLDKKKTILYAPSWDDTENSSSFWKCHDILINRLPENYNLIIKLHPNLSLQYEIQLEIIMEKYKNKSNLLFLKDFPVIYPLLNICDIYIGDHSSIGYDFLAFDKPMFFLGHNQNYLSKCGHVIAKIDKDFYEIMENLLSKDEKFKVIRKKTYDYTFDNLASLQTIKETII